MRRRKRITKPLSRQERGFDKSLLFLTLLFLVLGLLAVADASAPQALAVFQDSFYFVKQQVVWAVVGLVVMLVASFIHFSFWKKLAPVLFVISVILLIGVLIPGLGSKLLGARRWLALGPISLQPSELVKLTLIMFFAWLIERRAPLIYFLVPLVLVAGLIMLQPDLGTTIVILMIAFSLFFVSGVPLIHLLLVSAGGIAASLLLILVSGYRKARLLTFLKVTSDPLGSDYHIRQVLLALGSGGIFGVGLGQGRQKYLFLPEAATDSVFAVIAEEIGFLGAGILIVLLTFFIYKAVKISRRAPDTFSSMLGIGITAWIGGQMFLNIAAMTALVPLTGIPLPFFSYGGSSLTMVLFGVGILLNISKHGR